MDRTTIEVYGVPSYRREHYATIRRIMADGHKLPCSFATWRLCLENAERTLKREGKRMVRVQIDPETFRSWCAAHGLDLNSTARILYASIVAKYHAIGS